MNQACASLEDVLVAASGRAASLVPETSGYLALAVADATSRLPYLHDDRAVLLTVDGTVIVPRKGVVAPPPDAAKSLRDLLRRLLSLSTGSMPGLTSAARVRSEETDVERVVTDIEAALIPVNRSAAKRALARLARETLKARESGKLKRAQPAASAPKKGAPTVAAPMALAPTVAAPTVAVPTIAAPMALATRVAAPMALAPTVAAPTIAAPMTVAPTVAAPMTVAPTVAAPTIAAPTVAAPAIFAPAPSLAPTARLEIAPPPLVLAPPPAMASLLADVIASEAALAPHFATTPTPLHIDVTFEPRSPERAPDAAAPFFARDHEHDDHEHNDHEHNDQNESDQTIADPAAMAVIEAEYRAVAATPEPTFAAEEPAQIPVSDPDEEALTRPYRPTVEIRSLVHTPTASAPQAELICQLQGSRADELLEAFHAEDQGDVALANAAQSLRAFTEIHLAEPLSPSLAKASYQAAGSSGGAPPSRFQARYTDEDDLLPPPPPRAARESKSRWPLALFAIGILVLFSAWLYRPTLARDFFGLRSLLAPAFTPSHESERPQRDSDSPAAPQTDPAVFPASQSPGHPLPRDPHAKTATDGQQRRRD